MVVTLIIVLPGTNMPQIITTPWQDNASLLTNLQTVSQNAPTSAPFSFAVQYGGTTPGGGSTSGYNLVMLNGYWATNESATPAVSAPGSAPVMPGQPSFWAIQMNGQPLTQGVDEYMVQGGDVIVFIYNAPAPAAQ